MHTFETIKCVSLLRLLISDMNGDCLDEQEGWNASIPKKPLFPAVRLEALQSQCYWRVATVANYMHKDSRINDADSDYP